MAQQVFVSYSHDDRAWRDAFSQMLGPALGRYSAELWADDHIFSGERWERVIGDALGRAALGLLLITASHLESSFSWQVEVPALVDARVPIVWVLVEECLWEDNDLLGALQGLQDPSRDGALADHPNRKKEMARICRKIRDEHFRGPHSVAPPSLGVRPLRPVPELKQISPLGHGAVFGPIPQRPAAFVARSEDLDGLRSHLVAGMSAAVGVTGVTSRLGLYGQGGIGKTVLAAEVTRDPMTLNFFPDGVFWLSLGERPDVLGAQRQMAGWLGGDAEAIRSVLQGFKVLRELAADKQCLLVLDDVWSLGVAKALAVTGPKGRLLVTTRDRLVLERLGAATVSVDVLDVDAARDLLAQLTEMPPSRLPVEAARVLEASGRVALAVALLGAAVGRGGQTWVAVAARLTEGGEVFAGHPYADIFKALEVATASLDDVELDRYHALACFPGDSVIPAATIGRLWALGAPDLGAQLRRLADLRLARIEANGVAFHDLERDYLLLHAEAAAAAHDQLLATHRPAGGDWYRLEPSDPYLWDRLAYHLAAAGRHHELTATVADPAWLAMRIRRDGTLAAERDLLEALRWEPGHAGLRAVLRRLQQTAHLLDRAAATDAVAATLAVHLWPTRHDVDLARLDRAVFGDHPAVSWIADPTSHQLMRTLTGHDDTVDSVAWSPDGTRLASGSHDHTVRVWDPATGAVLHTLTGHQNTVASVAWSPDGTRLASGSHDDTLRVWDPITGAVLHTLTGHDTWVASVAWSPDGTRLASGSYDDTVRVWDPASGAVLHTLTGHQDTVASVAWSPDGTRLASGSHDDTLRVWDPITGAVLHTLTGHDTWVASVAWSPDSTRIASGSHDDTVRVWDPATGALVHTLTGHQNTVASVAWSPDSTRIASGSYDDTVRVWDPAGGAVLHTLTGHQNTVASVAWSPDGTRIASGSYDNRVRVWDAASGARLPTVTGHQNTVETVAWSPDGTRLASGSYDQTVRVWDSATGAALGTLMGHQNTVASVAWSPDGTRIASGSWDRTVRVWDPATGAVLRTLGGHDNWVDSVAWSPDGTRLASGSVDATVRVWDPGTGAVLRILTGHNNTVAAVAWSPDGTRLASGSYDGTVRIWDPDAGTLLRTLTIPDKTVDSVAWSPDGTRLASGSYDGTVRVSNANTGAPAHTIIGHASTVASVAWSPDGRRIASGSYDGTVRVSDTRTGGIIYRLVMGLDVGGIDYSARGALAIGVDRSVTVFNP